MRLLGIEHGSTDLIVYIEAPPVDLDDFAREVDEMIASIEYLEPWGIFEPADGPGG
jgi:hypothetical protein